MPSLLSKFSFIDKLGPGLLMAGAAIGVSHLVQSTKAGANFGFELWWAIVLVMLAKAPFFEFGPRYANATGKSLIEGYQDLGKWAPILFVLLTFATMFTVQAAVTMVTASIAIEIFGPIFGADLPGIQNWGVALLIICALINALGHYLILDKFIKIIILVLSITTITAVITAIIKAEPASFNYLNDFSFTNHAHIVFLIALMGWMPAPVDLSVWHSLWTLAKQRTLKEKLPLKICLLDFHIGYWGSMVIAFCFLGLGALTIHVSGEHLSPKGSVFARQVITIYTEQLGNWTYPIIASACFTTMFSTTLTCLDAFARVLRRAGQQLVIKLPQDEGNNGLYWFWIAFTVIGTIIVLLCLVQSMGQMVTVATILSFLTTPVLALMNYLVITKTNLPAQAKISTCMQIWSILGLLFLTGFALYFLKIQFS